VQVAAGRNWVRVEGTRRDRSPHEGCQPYQLEISYSHFERTVVLPVALERAEVSTDFRHGLLLVRIRMEADD
jgi:HSP20 family protein